MVLLDSVCALEGFLLPTTLSFRGGNQKCRLDESSYHFEMNLRFSLVPMFPKMDDDRAEMRLILISDDVVTIRSQTNVQTG
jgi:hypothetical protein